MAVKCLLIMSKCIFHWFLNHVPVAWSCHLGPVHILSITTKSFFQISIIKEWCAIFSVWCLISHLKKSAWPFNLKCLSLSKSLYDGLRTLWQPVTQPYTAWSKIVFVSLDFPPQVKEMRVRVGWSSCLSSLSLLPLYSSCSVVLVSGYPLTGMSNSETIMSSLE